MNVAVASRLAVSPYARRLARERNLPLEALRGSGPGGRILAIIGAGAALAISDIPFHHVLSAVRVGHVDGKLVVNPGYEASRQSKLNIVVAGTDSGIVMVEAGANQASEEEVLQAIEHGHECCKKIAVAINELVAKAGKPKKEYTTPAINEPLFQRVGTDRTEAIRVANERAQASWEHSWKDHRQAQAILQAASGVYYVTGLSRDGQTPFNIDGNASKGNPERYELQVLNPDVKAIVGPTTWVPNGI